MRYNTRSRNKLPIPKKENNDELIENEIIEEDLIEEDLSDID